MKKTICVRAVIFLLFCFYFFSLSIRAGGDLYSDTRKTLGMPGNEWVSTGSEPLPTGGPHGRKNGMEEATHMRVGPYTGTEAVSGAGGETLEQMKERIGFDRVWPSEKPGHEYAGVRKCSLCHKTKEQGEQYRIWLESPHARAYETLATPEAKDLAGKLGITDAQQSGKCLRCHATAYGFGEEKITEAVQAEEGVSCESCHGPGKDYLGLKIMNDRQKAVTKGLIIGNEQTCLKCHNETAPNIKEFHFDEAFEQIKHPVLR